jgi:hypothetical protein
MNLFSRTLVAHAPTKEALERIIGEYLAATVEIIDSRVYFKYDTSKTTIEGYCVRCHKNRWRFEQINDKPFC